MSLCIDSPARRCPAWSDPSTMHERRVRIGLVNNMPDAALDDTEHQFVALLDAAAGERMICLRRYRVDSVVRAEDARAKLQSSHFGVDDLYLDAPDAIIVTGAEPRCSDLRDESYWPDLARLLEWSRASRGSAMLSCLAAHAALLQFDGVTRTPLATKCSGVFRQRVVGGSPLTAGVDAASFPHSRNNEVASQTMQARGYDVLLDGGRHGWTAATRDEDGCSFVLLQGHPEYSLDTLLREYRRDLRRYLDGERLDYPDIPAGYLRRPGVVALEDFKSRATSRTRRPSADVMRGFPFDEAAASVAADWRPSARRLFRNWLSAVETRAELAAASC
jgi:homoserine O-succinyltransferase/O-acetyltransferase